MAHAIESKSQASLPTVTCSDLGSSLAWGRHSSVSNYKLAIIYIMIWIPTNSLRVELSDVRYSIKEDAIAVFVASSPGPRCSYDL